MIADGGSPPLLMLMLTPAAKPMLLMLRLKHIPGLMKWTHGSERLDFILRHKCHTDAGMRLKAKLMTYH